MAAWQMAAIPGFATMLANEVLMPATPINVIIFLQGSLDARWEFWFSGLQALVNAEGNTCLRGNLPDHAALHGTLERIRDLNLRLISVQVLPTEKQATQGENP
jgi:hypothetical protein